VRFWDSSAIVPLLVSEAESPSTQRLYADDPAMVVWWMTEVECVSALARGQRLGRLPDPVLTEALGRLAALKAAWHEVEPGDEVRESAKRFLRVHDLRAADALQLAAAFFVAEARPSTIEFVSLDERLLTAARREGFPVARAGTE
jgi:uncharacterized protein